MERRLKLALAISLLVNVVLIVGFFSYKSFVASHTTKGAVSMAEGEARLLQSMLADLESNDPERLEALKEQLKVRISTAQTAALQFQQAGQ